MGPDFELVLPNLNRPSLNTQIKNIPSLKRNSNRFHKYLGPFVPFVDVLIGYIFGSLPNFEN